MKIENIDKYNNPGIEALIFTADGDMRTAINNLQSTWKGYGAIDEEGVYMICDVPDVNTLRVVAQACSEGDFKTALGGARKLWNESHTAFDIANTLGKLMEGMKIEVGL